MSNLQDKINQARNNSQKQAEDALEYIEKQSYSLITDYDKITLDKPPRESRREAALKILEKAKKGEIDKIDEDEILNEHIQDKNTTSQYTEDTSQFTKDNKQDYHEDNIEVEDTTDIKKSSPEFESLSTLDKLRAISTLMSEPKDEDKDEDENENEDEIQTNINKNTNNDDNEKNNYQNTDAHEETTSNTKDKILDVGSQPENHNQNDEEQGFFSKFKKSMKKLFGG